MGPRWLTYAAKTSGASCTGCSCSLTLSLDGGSKNVTTQNYGLLTESESEPGCPQAKRGSRSSGTRTAFLTRDSRLRTHSALWLPEKPQVRVSKPTALGQLLPRIQTRAEQCVLPLPTGVGSNRVNLDHLALKPLSAVVCSTASRPQGPEQKGFFRSNLLPR